MLETGQKLWFVPTNRHRENAREVTVGKIGRKWAAVDGVGRIDVETLWADGGKYNSPGRCWISKEAWQAEISRQELWQSFQRRTSHHAPEGVSTETIRQAIAMLGFA